MLAVKGRKRLLTLIPKIDGWLCLSPWWVAFITRKYFLRVWSHEIVDESRRREFRSHHNFINGKTCLLRGLIIVDHSDIVIVNTAKTRSLKVLNGFSSHNRCEHTISRNWVIICVDLNWGETTVFNISYISWIVTLVRGWVITVQQRLILLINKVLSIGYLSFYLLPLVEIRQKNLFLVDLVSLRVISNSLPSFNILIRGEHRR